jgi:hypothetical protein
MPDWNERYHNLEYDSAVAMRYHGRRKEFFDALSRLDPALSVLFGGTAFAAVIKGYETVGAYAALLVAATSAVNLAFGLGERGRRHEGLFQRWGALRAKLAALAENDDVALRSLEVVRAEIDAESPWQLKVLSVLCENEEKAVRRDGSLYHVGTVQRTFANWFTLPGWRATPEISADGNHLPV